MRERPASGIRGRILLLLAVVFIPVFLIQVFIYYQRLRLLEQGAESANQETARLAGVEFAEFLQGMIDQQGVLGSAFSLDSAFTPDQMTLLLGSAVAENPALLDMQWVRPDGVVVAAARGVRVGEVHTLAPQVRQEAGRGAWTLGSLTLPENGGQPVFQLSRGVPGPDGALLGVLVATVEARQLRVAVSWRRPQQGILFILDPEGKASFSSSGTPLSWDQRDLLEHYRRLVGRDGRTEASDFLVLPGGRGRYLFSFSPVAHTGWLAVSGNSWQAVLEPESSLLRSKTFLYLTVTAAALAAALKVAYSIIRPIRRLRKAALSLADFRTGAEFADGGPAELRDLSRVLQDARAVLHRSHEELEGVVADRTAQLQQANERLLREIMERERVDEELLRAKEAAERANSAKSEFLAHMSHEIRTPLAAVIGMAEVLAMRIPEGDGNGRMVALLQESARSLLAIIGDILDFSRIEAGKVEVHSVELQVEPLLRSVVDAFRPSASLKGLSLELEVDGRVPRSVAGDEKLLSQVLRNLVSNAVKYTGRGKVTVRVRRAAGPSQAEGLEYTVADTGPGIPAGKLETLFRSFSRVHDERTQAAPDGTGLGLAISRKLVELMGGEIGVVSEPGRGSLFWFRLPLRGRQAAEGPDAVAPRPVRGGNPLGALSPMEVLVVDDDPGSRVYLEAAFRDAGHRVTLAADGSQALDSAAQTRFDLVLMDIRMPGIDGLEATRRIRALPGRAASPALIVLTASAVSGDEERSRQAGADGYLSKPVGSFRLAEEVRRALAARQAA